MNDPRLGRLISLVALYFLILVSAPGPLPKPILPPVLALAPLLIAITVIDLERMQIPNWANAAVALLGLWFVSVAARDWLATHAIAALIVGGGLWFASEALFRLRGSDMLGLGDVKFIAAATVWIGVDGLPTLLLYASLTGVVLTMLTRKRFGDAVPFGPFLAASLWAAVLFGPVL